MVSNLHKTWLATIIKKTNFILIRHILLSINTPGTLLCIWAHETVAGTKNAGADKKKSKRVLFLDIASFIDLSHFIFFEISELNYLYYTAVNAISKTNWPFLFQNSSYNFKTFTKIPHSQWFIDILGMSICPLRTADQLERLTLGTRALATRNRVSFFNTI